MPSEESLKKLEKANVTRGEVTELFQMWNGGLTTAAAMSDISNKCAQLIQSGSDSHDEFISCSAWIWSLSNNYQMILGDNVGPLSVLNSSK